VDSFPALRTGAVAQYGSDRTRLYSNNVFRFVDGSEQRFAAYASPLRKWTIRLELLQESELVQLEQFFAAHAGRGGMFSFTDPWDGVTYTNCSFDNDSLATEYSSENRGRTMITIKENRT